MRIRRASKSDSVALSAFAIETYCTAFGHTFSATDLTGHLQKNLAPNNFAAILETDIVLVAVEEDRLVGYVQFGDADSQVFVTAISPRDQELRRLYVQRDHQNQGFGSRLMDIALMHPRMTHAISIYLDVWEHNHRAQRFYRRYGFEVVGTHPFEVESGAETSLDLIMVRRLPDSRR